MKNRLINLHCFIDRTYPNPPQWPLIFTSALPIVDKPLPRFLDDAAATKLMRASRANPDPLSRLIVEILARAGIRKSELLGLTVDAVVQIGSVFWLRIPVGSYTTTATSSCTPNSRRCSTTGSRTTDRPGCAQTAFCSSATGPSPHCGSPPP